MYSGITSGRVLDGELLYTKILEVNPLALAYRPPHEDLSPIDGTHVTHVPSTGHMSHMSHRLKRNPYETVCRQMQTT